MFVRVGVQSFQVKERNSPCLVNTAQHLGGNGLSCPCQLVNMWYYNPSNSFSLARLMASLDVIEILWIISNYWMRLSMI